MSAETPSSPNRLQGTLVRRLAEKATAASVSQGGEGTTQSRRIRVGCLDVELGAGSRDIVLGSGARAVTDAAIGGFWHLSASKIDRFENSKGTGRASNLGPGTYVGYGNLTGDKIRNLSDSAHVKHEIVLHGNILLVPLEDQDDTSWEVAERTVGDEGLHAVADMAPSKRINALLRDYLLEGEKFDGFVFYSETTGNAEGVAFYPEQMLEVVGRHVVE